MAAPALAGGTGWQLELAKGRRDQPGLWPGSVVDLWPRALQGSPWKLGRSLGSSCQHRCMRRRRLAQARGRGLQTGGSSGRCPFTTFTMMCRMFFSSAGRGAIRTRQRWRKQGREDHSLPSASWGLLSPGPQRPSLQRPPVSTSGHTGARPCGSQLALFGPQPLPGWGRLR